MKKRIFALAVVLILVAFAFAGCAGGHKITNISSDDWAINDCPTSANAGDTVKIETYCVEDATVYVRINDENIAPEGWSGGEIEFVMPDEDVVINVGAVSNGLA